MNVEALLIQWGNRTELLTDPFHFNVPSDRPERFFTVERTGGAGENYRDLPTVAVQAWAPSRSEAALLMDAFVDAVWAELQYEQGIARVDINTVSHFPGANGEPRYQAVLQLVAA